MVIFYSENDLRRSVVPTLHIEESGRAVFATGAEVDYFYLIILIIREQYVLRLHITMNNAFILHEF